MSPRVPLLVPAVFLGAMLMPMLTTAGAAVAQTAQGSPASQPSSPGSPTEQMSTYTDQVQKLLRDMGPDGLHVAIRKKAVRMFGVGEAAREALGQHWQDRTRAERDEFAELFADLLEATYVAQLNRPGGVQLHYTGEQVQGDRAAVLLTVQTERGSQVKTEIRLVQREQRWLIRDVAIEGVSLIQTYRAQFDRIIKRSSYSELVRLIKAKIDDLYRAKA